MTRGLLICVRLLLSFDLGEKKKNRIVKMHLNTKRSLLCFFVAAQIMELHQKIKPLEDEISDLKEANTENLEGKKKKMLTLVLSCALR